MMKMPILPVVLGSILATTMPGSVVAAQEVGITAALRNNVRITTNARQALHPAVLREKVSLGNDVLTGSASMAQLLLLDKTSFTVGANARVRIDRFVYDPSKSASSVGASVAKGAFRFMSGKSLHARPGESSIRTPAATIGIRGTIVEGAVGPDAIRIAREEAGIPSGFAADEQSATLIVLRGPGRNAKAATPGAIDVTVGNTVISIEEPGIALFVPGSGEPPIGPFYLSDKGARMLRLLLGAQPLPREDSPWIPDPVTNKTFEDLIRGQ